MTIKQPTDAVYSGHTDETMSGTIGGQGGITRQQHLLEGDTSFTFSSPADSIWGNLRDDEWWKHRPITSIIQKSMCEQLFPGSLDRDHIKSDDTMIEALSPQHAVCEDQSLVR